VSQAGEALRQLVGGAVLKPHAERRTRRARLTERAHAAGVSDVLRKPLVSRDIAEPLARVGR
jgi:hypothetical protein